MQQRVVTTAKTGTVAERRLTLGEVLDWLVEDGLVAAPAAEELKKERRYYRGGQHPLATVADQKWRQATPPGKVMTLSCTFDARLLDAELVACVLRHIGDALENPESAWGPPAPEVPSAR